MVSRFKSLDVIILCGGEGKRLRPVVDGRPKVMAEIDSRPFLDILIRKIAGHGFKKAILCIGYKGEMIKDYYDRRTAPLKIIYSEESKPLGTGGALKNARPFIESQTFLVMNGDTVSKVDLNSFFNFHLAKKAMMSMALVRSEADGDFGSVSLDPSFRIISFKEKVKSDRQRLVNAGAYFMNKDIFSHMPKISSFSLEYDLFPDIVKARCYGFLSKSKFIDIGSPERYGKARKILGGYQ